MSLYTLFSTQNTIQFAQASQVNSTVRSPEGNTLNLALQHLHEHPNDIIKCERWMHYEKHNTFYYRYKNGCIERSDDNMHTWK